MEVAICWTITSISRGFSNVKCCSRNSEKKTVRAGTREKMKKFKTEDFNPRTRVGTTNQYLVVFPLILYFNPRTRVGYDRASLPRLWPHWFSRGSKYPTLLSKVDNRTLS